MNSTAHVDEEVHGRVMEVNLHGKLGREDYYRFIPDTEKMIREHGRLRLLVTMHDFHGWEANALWEDIKWNAKHFHQIERMAVVGERNWHKLMTGFYKPFTTAAVRYFTLDQLDAARAWINETMEEDKYSEMTMPELIDAQKKVVSDFNKKDQRSAFRPGELWDGSEVDGGKQP